MKPCDFCKVFCGFKHCVVYKDNVFCVECEAETRDLCICEKEEEESDE